MRAVAMHFYVDHVAWQHEHLHIAVRHHVELVAYVAGNQRLQVIIVDGCAIGIAKCLQRSLSQAEPILEVNVCGDLGAGWVGRGEQWRAGWGRGWDRRRCWR